MSTHAPSGNGDRGALPEELREVDTSTLVIQHERRISNLETDVLDVRGTVAKVDNNVLKMMDDIHKITVALAGDAGEKRAIEGVKKAYVRPIVVAALIACLGLGAAAFAGGVKRDAPTAAQVAAEVVKQMKGQTP